MSVADQKQFTDAVAKARQGFWSGTIGIFTDDWKAAMHACSRLSMPDMLQALNAVYSDERRFLLTGTPRNPRAPLNPRIRPSEDRLAVLGKQAFARLVFAVSVIDHREIEDQGVLDDQVNDGREFLGCTRLDDAGVRKLIVDALATAGAVDVTTPTSAQLHDAWYPTLVFERRKPNASMIANLAAAAHYMLSRYHVCSAKASISGMKTVIDAYDAKKRLHVATGDRDLKDMALTGNRPFPVDFAIARWSYRGAEEGEGDRLRCNPDETPSIFPDVNGQEY